VPALKALKEDGRAIALVVSEPARPAGRNRALRASPVADAARALDLDLYTPETLRTDEVQKSILEYEPDVMVVASYGKIIPKNIFDAPPLKTVNIHASCLPEFRGASPIQQALREGKKETGVTLIVIDELVDHGPILSQEVLLIDPDDTYLTLEPKLAALGARMIVRDLRQYAAGEITPRPQDHARATFTKKIKKEEGKVDWNRSVQDIYNLWRAFVRWPGLYTFSNGKRLNLIEVAPVDSPRMDPGSLFENSGILCAAASDGALEIRKLAPEGRNVLTAKEFLSGYRTLLGTVLK
jgi:methionyl-tRNA formyltransferase